MKTEWQLNDGLENQPKGMIFIIETPRFNAMVTGAYKAEFGSDGRVTLVYEDNSKETAQFTIKEAQALTNLDWFAIVSAIQFKARQGIKKCT